MLQGTLQPLCHMDLSVARKLQRTVNETTNMQSEDIYDIMIQAYTIEHGTAVNIFRSQVADIQMKGPFTYVKIINMNIYIYIYICFLLIIFTYVYIYMYISMLIYTNKYILMYIRSIYM